jgi:catechol-2,3-dioxygenase
MDSVNSLRLGHVGIFVHDLELMVGFYQRVLRFIITDTDIDKDGNRHAVFLSRNPADHHQLVLVSGRAAHAPPLSIQQISFVAMTIDEVRRTYQALLHEKISQIDPVTHGTAWSVYFRDPEENRIEVFVESDWYITQPFVAPIDFNKSDATIRAETEALCCRQPGFQPMTEWRQNTAERLMRAIAASPTTRA